MGTVLPNISSQDTGEGQRLVNFQRGETTAALFWQPRWKVKAVTLSSRRASSKGQTPARGKGWWSREVWCDKDAQQWGSTGYPVEGMAFPGLPEGAVLHPGCIPWPGEGVWTLAIVSHWPGSLLTRDGCWQYPCGWKSLTLSGSVVVMTHTQWALSSYCTG